MVTEMKYGKDTANYAKHLLRRGDTYAQVESETGISQNTLRQWKYRMEKAENKKSNTPEPSAHEPDEQAESVTIVTPEQKPVSIRRYKALELEAVFYATTAAACYGFVTALPGVIGWALAAVYALLCFNSLQMAKNEDIPATAEHGKNRIWALELVAVFAHYFTVNRALWSNLDALPFGVKYVPEGGVWITDFAGNKTNGIWQGGQIIFYLSCTVAVLLSAAAIEAVSTRLKLTKEQKNN